MHRPRCDPRDACARRRRSSRARRPGRARSVSARSTSVSSSSSPSGSRRNSVLRESSGPVSEKNGFSVVAPTNTRSPSSTNGRRTSCWARLKRWTSSRKRIVPCPCSPSRARPAPRSRARPSLRPTTAERFSKALAVAPAMSLATVVLPIPGGPQRMRDESRSASIRTRSGLPGPEEVLLADHFVEGRRAQARRERRPPRQPVVNCGGEQIGALRHSRRLRRPLRIQQLAGVVPPPSVL